MVLNEKEKKAIGEKLRNPNSDVKCPRCGGDLRYVDRGASIAIICSTSRCINGGLRGI